MVSIRHPAATCLILAIADDDAQPRPAPASAELRRIGASRRTHVDRTGRRTDNHRADARRPRAGLQGLSTSTTVCTRPGRPGTCSISRRARGSRIASTSTDSVRRSSSARRTSRSCSRRPRTSTSCACACGSTLRSGLAAGSYPMPRQAVGFRVLSLPAVYGVRRTAPNLAEVRHRVAVLRVAGRKNGSGVPASLRRPRCSPRHPSGRSIHRVRRSPHRPAHELARRPARAHRCPAPAASSPRSRA